MTDIRIPTRWILEMADKLRTDPNVEEFNFTTEGGNTLHAKRRQGKYDPEQRERLEIPRTHWDAWDFIYNPGD